ncbi:unnamed protein product [Eruca vesicaria subsp. sativa]|uniref:Translocation protein SEC62 n=1 Tax=Eruca vesicaria subsp. sativa TaxID=29727 RepID=A0ABC8L7N7_ERUVS|nr:unnamed protein product [Eruca vesicaria subsp. sativa]
MKKPGGTEKKRIKRSSGSSSSTRTTTRFWFRSSTEEERCEEGCISVVCRENKGQQGVGINIGWCYKKKRVVYFRGKYFVSFLKNHPECKEILKEDKDLDAEDIGNVLLERNVLVRCDRVTKTVCPGKKKLST